MMARSRSSRFFLAAKFVCFTVLLLPALAYADTQRGVVRSGEQAIAFAKVKLFQAGTDYEEKATLLGQTYSRHDGSFKVKFKPPKDKDAVLYLVAQGGKTEGESWKAFVSGHKNRGTVTLTTVLGSKDIPHEVTINERTTVATAYTMNQFLAGKHIAGPGIGVPIAGDILRNLVSLESGDIGEVLGSRPNGAQTNTLRTFNTLANILSNCVQDRDSCDELFELVTPEGLNQARTTLQAALYMARYPDTNADALQAYALEQKTYRPLLREAPVAWTLAIRYFGNGHEMDGPGIVAFDSKGTAWIANNYTYKKGTADPNGRVCGAKDVLRLTPTGEDVEGAPYRGGGANGAGFGIVVDKYDAVWQGNFGFAGENCRNKRRVLWLSHSVSKYDNDGNALSPDNMPGNRGGFLADGNIFGPQGMAVDPVNNNIWISNCRNNQRRGNTVTVLKHGHEGSAFSFNPFEPTKAEELDPGFLTKPFGMTVDIHGQAWVAGSNISQVVGVDEHGNTIAVFGKKDTEEGKEGRDRDIHRPMGIAADSQGGIWVSNSGVVDIACGYQIHPNDPNTIIGEDSTYKSLQAAGILDEEGNPTDNYDGHLGSIALITKDKITGKYELVKFTGSTVVPWGIALDGNDNVWVANFDGQKMSVLCGRNPETCPPGKQETGAAISPGLGYPFEGLVRNTGVSIDPAGNVWLTNNWLQKPIQTNPGGRHVVLFLGMAKPVKTPLLGYPRAAD